jgi:hypothetical protein
MTGLERRCRRLLFAYPASYRRDRGEEIIATLLEATEPGRAWPSPRDARALIAGGLRARVAQNRGLSTATSVRLAFLLGAAAYLSFEAAGYLAGVIAEPGIAQALDAYAWLTLATGLLLLATVAVAWLAPRPAGLVMAVAAGVAGTSRVLAVSPGARVWDPSLGWAEAAVTGLLPLVLVVVLSGREPRPPRSWLWIIGLFALVPLAAHLSLDVGLAFPVMYEILLLVPLATIIAWGILDARTLLALAVALALFGLAIVPLVGWSARLDLWPLFAVELALAASGGWRLRRRTSG